MSYMQYLDSYMSMAGRGLYWESYRYTIQYQLFLLIQISGTILCEGYRDSQGYWCLEGLAWAFRSSAILRAFVNIFGIYFFKLYIEFCFNRLLDISYTLAHYVFQYVDRDIFQWLSQLVLVLLFASFFTTAVPW